MDRCVWGRGPLCQLLTLKFLEQRGLEFWGGAGEGPGRQEREHWEDLGLGLFINYCGSISLF